MGVEVFGTLSMFSPMPCQLPPRLLMVIAFPLLRCSAPAGTVERAGRCSLAPSPLAHGLRERSSAAATRPHTRWGRPFKGGTTHVVAGTTTAADPTPELKLPPPGTYELQITPPAPSRFVQEAPYHSALFAQVALHMTLLDEGVVAPETVPELEKNPLENVTVRFGRGNSMPPVCSGGASCSAETQSKMDCTVCGAPRRGCPARSGAAPAPRWPDWSNPDTRAQAPRSGTHRRPESRIPSASSLPCATADSCRYLLVTPQERRRSLRTSVADRRVRRLAVRNAKVKSGRRH